MTHLFKKFNDKIEQESVHLLNEFMFLNFVLYKKLIQFYDHIISFLLFLMLEIIFFDKFDNTAEHIHVNDFDFSYKNLL